MTPEIELLWKRLNEAHLHVAAIEREIDAACDACDHDYDPRWRECTKCGRQAPNVEPIE